MCVLHRPVCDGYCRRRSHNHSKNSGKGESKSPRLLNKDRIYGMSNGGIDLWDKVDRGKAKFKDLIEQSDKDYNEWV